MIVEQYDRARSIVEDNRAKIEVMAHSLLEWETLDSSQVDEIMAGKNPTPPPQVPDRKRPPSSDSRPDGSPLLEESDLDLPNPDRLN